jgi:predicted nucleic acid-binding protein
MKILLDTNIIIHREANTVINKDIGQLFNWIDKLHYNKFIHPITTKELEKYSNKSTVKTIQIKLQSYSQLQTISPIDSIIQEILDKEDKTENDKNDTLLLNEVYNDRVDVLITEDKNIHRKADKLSIANRVFNISNFLDNVLSANPQLIDYKVLSVKKTLFGKLDLNDEFFDSFKLTYKGFEKWFNKKSEEIAYVSIYENRLRGFLFIKVEDKNENYSNVRPMFEPKKRLKIGTFKVNLYGVKLGERFLKIIFDNAVEQKVDEIYFTIFNDTIERKTLINLMMDFGFKYHGIKVTESGNEEIYVREFNKSIDVNNPRLSFPYISNSNRAYFVSIFPQYHTELFPDSILNTESPADFIENEPHRNAISKVYISHSKFRDLKKSDILVFYRTGGIYKGVITTIAIVEKVNMVESEKELIKICRGKTLLTKSELSEFWNKFLPNIKPFVISFLYAYSLPKRPNLKELIDAGIFESPTSLPRGISNITKENFEKILKLAQANENIIVN